MENIGEASARSMITAADFPPEKTIFVNLIATRERLEIRCEEYRVMQGLAQMRTVGEISLDYKIPEAEVYRILKSKKFNDWF